MANESSSSDSSSGSDSDDSFLETGLMLYTVALACYTSILLDSDDESDSDDDSSSAGPIISRKGGQSAKRLERMTARGGAEPNNARHSDEDSSSAAPIISRKGEPSANRLETMTARGGAEPNKRRRLRVKAYGDGQLLPGIPNDVTLDHICPRLPRTSKWVLSAVSRAWLRAFRSKQVYKARVRFNSTEAFALIKLFPSFDFNAIALYSMSGKNYSELPPIPNMRRGIPLSCEILSFDGKVYVVGGEFKQSLRDLCEVYVLDLAAGKGQWKKCASMQEPRQGFGCGAINGKIYVFGGYIGDPRYPVLSSEVYNPRKDTWSPMSAMASLRTGSQVTRLGEELFVHGGSLFGDEYFDWVERLEDSGKDLIDRVLELRELDDDDESEEDGATYIRCDDSLEVYHPIRRKWRTVEHFHSRTSGPVFVAQGKFHTVEYTGIKVYDIDKNEWSLLHSHSYPSLRTGDTLITVPLAVLAVEDELLAILQYIDPIGHKGGTILVRGRGLGVVNKEIVWEEIEGGPSFPSWPPRRHFIHPIQL